MERYINEWSKECFRDVLPEDTFDVSLFHVVSNIIDDDYQLALHTNLGSITILDRMTGFGYRDIETGYRSPEGKFWLASGMCDVRDSGSETFGEAINWIMANANTCIGE